MYPIGQVVVDRSQIVGASDGRSEVLKCLRWLFLNKAYFAASRQRIDVGGILSENRSECLVSFIRVAIGRGQRRQKAGRIAAGRFESLREGRASHPLVDRHSHSRARGRLDASGAGGAKSVMPLCSRLALAVSPFRR